MTFQRQLNWTGAMRDLRAQRTPAKPGYLAARAIARAKAECELRAIRARPLVVDGAYDLSAIMRCALADARDQRARGVKAPFKVLLRSALRFVWMRAKMARAAAAH